MLKFGNIPWKRADLINGLHEFSEVYKNRSNRNNIGGMKSAHMYPVWFLTRHLNPSHIIESGVYKGCGTWLFDQAAPFAHKTCIEPVQNIIQYKSPMANYTTTDFTLHDWSTFPKDRTLLFFDDHQDEIERIKTAFDMGFIHIMCEDNYPAGQGPWQGAIPYSRIDSPKKSFMSGGGKWIKKNCDIYYEFPPIFKEEKTRWGDNWDKYPTPEPLCDTVECNYLQTFKDECLDYTWICYLKLKRPPNETL